MKDSERTGGTPASDGELARATLDTFPINVAVIDAEGDILLTNRAWREFAGDQRERDDDVGVNYFAAADADDADTDAAVDGIRSVLDGEREKFRMEYPCHSPDSQQWFMMRVSAVDVDGERGAVVAHVDITDRKEAELSAEERADQLEHLLDRVDGLVREGTRAVVGARSRGAVESGLCQAVVSADTYTFAWVGRPDLRAESLVPRGWAGDGPEDVEARTLSLSTDSPAGRAYRTGELQVVTGDPAEANTDVAEDGVDDEERVAADGASAVDGEGDTLGGWAPVPGAGAVAAVPLAYRSSTYGVLSVYVDEADAFDERERMVLASLGEVAATGIHATTSGRVLDSRSVVEMEVQVDAPGTYLTALAAGDATLHHHDAFLDDEGTVTVFLTVEGVDAETIRQRADDVRAVEEVTLLTDRDDGTLVELTVTDSLVATMAEFDGVTRTMTTDGGTVTATLWFPDEGSARAAFEHLGETHEAVELAGYRDRERSSDSGAGFRADLESSLTDRQLTALRTAYHSGYFEWPRDVSGEEVAETMGITRATFHQHLREAQRKLTAALLEPDPP
jgi:PAS domain S-box-containing protein